MIRCAAIKGNGERCRGIAATSSDYCPAHEPSRQEARRRAASKAAKSKGGKGAPELLYDQTRKLYERIERGEVEPKVATVLVQAVNAQTRILELQRRVEFANLMAPEEFQEVIHTVQNVLNHRVKDFETRKAIVRDFTKLADKHR